MQNHYYRKFGIHFKRPICFLLYDASFQADTWYVRINFDPSSMQRIGWSAKTNYKGWAGNWWTPEEAIGSRTANFLLTLE